MSKVFVVAARLAVAVAAIGFATPTWAAWDHIYSVDVGSESDKTKLLRDFPAPVERLRLQPEGSAVECRSVKVVLDGGRTRTVFSGRLEVDRAHFVDLAKEQVALKRIEIECRSLGQSAKVEIAAELGHFRDEPGWTQVFDSRSYYWIPLGSERFSHPTDFEYIRIENLRLSGIGLKPINDDAFCSDVEVQFADGSNTRLNITAADRLEKGHLFYLDFPGGKHRLKRIELNCRPHQADGVTIGIYASK